MRNPEGFGPREIGAADNSLSNTEREVVFLCADLRWRAQELKINILNLGLTGTTPEMKAVYDEQTALVGREAAGNESVPEEQKARAAEVILTLTQKAEAAAELFPELITLGYAKAAKVKETAGSQASGSESLEQLLAKARQASTETKELPKVTPANLLSDAILLGVQKRLAEKTPLPSQEKIAAVAITDADLLREYALVLGEEERGRFLDLLPEARQKAAGRELDAAVAPLLHQALIDKGSAEVSQRSKIRARLFQELQGAVQAGSKDETAAVKLLSRAMVELGEDTRQLLLEIIRDESERAGGPRDKDHLPRVIKVFLENFDDFRGNDTVLRLAGETSLSPHLSWYLLGKLVEKKYLAEEVKTWWQEGRNARRLEVIKGVVSELGVMPSREILQFIYQDRDWKTSMIGERLGEIRARQAEFDKISDSRELVRYLAGDAHAAMIYYLLHGGEDRFNLINNYGFDKFKEMLGLTAQLEVHEEPLKKFEKALADGGTEKKEIKATVERLRAGHFPLANTEQGYQEVGFEVSENASVKNANAEIGRVLGRGELGVVLLFPMYREFLQKINDETAQQWLERMSGVTTMADRLALINEMEQQYPDFRARAKTELEDNWKKLGEKMLLEATLDNVFDEEHVPIRGEELIPRLDAKRLDLKKMKKDLLVALRGGNDRAKAVTGKITQKRKALGGLRKGLEHQVNESARTKIEKQIAGIEEELKALEAERALIGEQEVQERFAHLTPEQKKDEVERLAKEIIALTEKSPSAIFTFVTMQVLGEERLRESDVALVQELESHLQGPFQTIQDTLTYQKPAARGEEKKRQRVGLRYVDKAKQLMHLVRFADSKICCFSSNNYEMVVQHDVANKFWVASINADPLSFVVSMEIPGGSPRENLGFIFGNFALDDEGNLALMLNGIYYAPGIEDSAQVEAILNGVQSMFTGLPVKNLALASQHGGSIKMPEGFTNEPITLTRLRALDDGSGRPESKIYDDLGTGDSLNQPMVYNASEAGNVWHNNI